MGYNPSISVTLPLAYSSDKRVLLFVCVLGETCFLHLDLEGSAYFVLSLPDCLFQNTDFLLVVCYVVRCYISLIWPEASQHRDFFRSILFYLFVPGALFPGKSSGFIEVDSCSLSLKNMKSRPIRPRPPFHPLSLIHPDVFYIASIVFLDFIASLQWRLGLTSFSLVSSTHFILGIPSLASHLGIHFRRLFLFSCSSSALGPEMIYPIFLFTNHYSTVCLPTILRYFEIYNERLRIPSKVILDNILIDRYI